MTPPAHNKLRLYVGVISAEPHTFGQLLKSFKSLDLSNFERLAFVVLDNGDVAAQLAAQGEAYQEVGISVVVISEVQQKTDARQGAFGSALRERPEGRVSIAKARTMLQRYLGSLLAGDTGAYGWLLDDDMRVDKRADCYLQWLAEFREQGVDVLLGSYDGVSPNPPLNGLRVNLVDLLHNLHWLRSLPGNIELPDRSRENRSMREKYPDYYYDLSRKHTGHLEMPHWLEPEYKGETVFEAHSRILAGASGLLVGQSMTRPLVSESPCNPMSDARDSVNRGGNTFILNHEAITQTPNTIAMIDGRDARRSDMIWAIVNQRYRCMNIKAVNFSVLHVTRSNVKPSVGIKKVREELVGAALYAGLTEFLQTHPDHKLEFSPHESALITRSVHQQLSERIHVMRGSFDRIVELRESLRTIQINDELTALITCLDQWFHTDNIDNIFSGLASGNSNEIELFLHSLQQSADDYSKGSIELNFLLSQFQGV